MNISKFAIEVVFYLLAYTIGVLVHNAFPMPIWGQCLAGAGLGITLGIILYHFILPKIFPKENK